MADLQNPGKGGDSGNPPGGSLVDLSAVKRKPGRPSNAERAARGENSSSKPTGDKSKKSDAPRVVAENLDAGFLADAVCYLFEAADETLAARAMARIQKLFPAPEAEIETLVREAALSERDLELVRKCVLRIAAKYDFVSKYAPEILLFGMGAQYAARQARVFAHIANMEKRFAVAKNVTPNPVQPKVEPAKT